MFSILYLTTVALLVSIANSQQPQLVYEQHFLDPQAQAPSFQPFPQEYAEAIPEQQFQNPDRIDSDGFHQHFNEQPAQQQQMGFAQQPQIGFSQLPPPGHGQFHQGPDAMQQPPHQHRAIGIPISPMQLHQQAFMQHQPPPPQFVNQPPPGFHQQPPQHQGQMIPVGMNPSEFADRRGALDNMIKGVNPFKRSKKPKQTQRGNNNRQRGPPIKMMDMNRIPKPPKYPLYDMPSIGMATPPPAPLMHPMSHISSASSNSYSTFVKSPRGGPMHQRRNQYQQSNRRRYPPMLNRPGKNRQQPPGKQPPRNQRRPHPGSKHFPVQHGFEHPMASNLDPQISSPPLGRPLSFDEYMERPSHSFTDDPWNFDPFAAQYNSGMNTYAMKYNYDPLGMNVVDGSQSHLDPNKLSYPGDYFSLQDTSTVMKSPKLSQLGGWDKPPETYRSSTTKLLPPLIKDRNRGIPAGHNRQQDRFDRNKDQQRAEQRPNSFNVFDTVSSDSTIVKSETINPLTLLSGTTSPIEFSIEPSGGNDQYQNQYNIGQEAGPPQEWMNYNQQSRQQPFQPTTYGNSQSQNSYTNRDDHDTAQSENHENHPSRPDYDTPAESNSRKEDYVHHERPYHNLSDNYSPLGDLNADMSPPHDDSDSLFRRNGMRATRQEKTPMVEMEGLSLFKDVLRNANASGARKHLYSALLN